MDFTRKNISRVYRSKRNAMRAYNRLSRWYDLFAGSEDRFTDRGIRQLDVRKGEIVLEIGPGTGKALVKFAKAVEQDGLVVGLDLAFGMVNAAQKRLSQAQVKKQVAFNLGDGAWLPFPTGTFDAVFMAFTLELFDTPEIPQVLHECWRVLRPNGRIGVVSLAVPQGFAPVVSAYEWTHRRFPTLADCRPIPAAEFVEGTGFSLQECFRSPMWGMPVEIVMGRKRAINKALGISSALNQENLN